MVGLFLFLIIVGIASFACSFACFVNEERRGAIILMLISIICIIASVIIYNTDAQRTVNSDMVIVKYSKIREITSTNIILDDNTYYKNSIIEKKYPINYNEFNSGDIVRYEYVSGINDYLIKMTKIK